MTNYELHSRFHKDGAGIFRDIKQNQQRHTPLPAIVCEYFDRAKHTTSMDFVSDPAGPADIAVHPSEGLSVVVNTFWTDSTSMFHRTLGLIPILVDVHGGPPTRIREHYPHRFIDRTLAQLVFRYIKPFPWPFWLKPFCLKGHCGSTHLLVCREVVSFVLVFVRRLCASNCHYHQVWKIWVHCCVPALCG